MSNIISINIRHCCNSHGSDFEIRPFCDVRDIYYWDGDLLKHVYNKNETKKA